MSRFIVNHKDLTKKLKDFNLVCKNCGSENVDLRIDEGFYTSDSWFDVLIGCNDCQEMEVIYSLG